MDIKREEEKFKEQQRVINKILFLFDSIFLVQIILIRFFHLPFLSYLCGHISIMLHGTYQYHFYVDGKE